MLDLSKIVCLVGPTASGKSRLALELAKEFEGEIVNADSRQFYRELVIGTAKPGKDELEFVPHHLIDCASILQPWTVATFRERACVAIDDVIRRGKVPFVVGGTGMYVKCLLFGLDEIPEVNPEIHASLNRDLKEKGLKALYEELKAHDPAAGKRLESSDTHRILRALGVYRQTGRCIDEFWKRNESAAQYDYLKLALNVERDELYGRINERVLQMTEDGLEGEIKTLLREYPDNLILRKTIGYAEWLEYGVEDKDRVCSAIAQNTRRFAKRQLTWFRNENDVKWIDKPFEINLRTAVREFIK